MQGPAVPLDALARWIAGQRWFAAKSRRVVGVSVEDGIRLGDGTLWLLRVGLDDGSSARYAVPLRDGSDIAEALDDPGFCRALLALIATGGRAAGAYGELRGSPTTALSAGTAAGATPRRLRVEQSNTSVVFGDVLILKHFRHLHAGDNPDIEITRYLTEHTTFRHTPRLYGSLAYHDGAGEWAVGVAQELVRDGRDGWSFVLDRLGAGDAALAALERLGRVTAELHQALVAGDATTEAMAPAPITADDVSAWTAGVQRQLDAAGEALAGRWPDGVPRRIDTGALGGLLDAVKLRHHGDFHLGQTLAIREGADWAIIDFEGEPLRSLAERRAKHTPLRDVAGMLRSLGYAAAAGAAPAGWEAQARDAFLHAYRTAAAGASFLPAQETALTRALAVLEVEKAAYEVVYEANNRPDWLPIPVRGLVSAAARAGRPDRGAGGP
jgi:trehalose synthase-fused probable maltokinase